MTSDLIFRIIISVAYLILFVEEIPKLVCKCILGWRSVPSHFVTLTYDLVYRTGIESGAYILYSLK